MLKQPACAAAISSSGLVPLPSPKRAVNEYGVSFSVALWVARLPLPSLPLPCHSALACRLIAMSDLLLTEALHVWCRRTICRTNLPIGRLRRIVHANVAREESVAVRDHRSEAGDRGNRRGDFRRRSG